MLTSVAPTKLADDVYETSNKEEVFNQTHTPTSLDKSHAISETSRANLSKDFFISSWNVYNYDATILLPLST